MKLQSPPKRWRVALGCIAVVALLCGSLQLAAGPQNPEHGAIWNRYVGPPPSISCGPNRTCAQCVTYFNSQEVARGPATCIVDSAMYTPCISAFDS
ncbi:MAG: hypothetical protein AAF604_02465 [Acidobacteriota bacterium]